LGEGIFLLVVDDYFVKIKGYDNFLECQLMFINWTES